MSLSCSSKNLMAPSSNSTSSEQCYVLLFSALFQFIPTSKYECMHRVSMIFQIILHPALLKCATSTSALSLPVVTSSNTHSVLGRANAKKNQYCFHYGNTSSWEDSWPVRWADSLQKPGHWRPGSIATNKNSHKLSNENSESSRPVNKVN